MPIDDLIQKSKNNEPLTRDELVRLLSCPPDSEVSYRIMAAARQISMALTQNKAEIHGQFALNLAPCRCNCKFCSFAACNGVFQDETRISVETALDYARRFETVGANAVVMMTTAQYPFEKFIEIGQEVRRHLKPETTLIANVGDQTVDSACKMKDAGFAGVYHAIRLREGIDTRLSPEKRKESMRHFKEAGLVVGTCVEPVGPEHTNEELADMILYTASIDPAYSGAARRISIPGTPMAELGMISELRMAQIVAVTRLGMPWTVPGNCTHEPCTLGAMGGANLFWAEVGANPRDTLKRTEEGRGATVSSCRTLFQESGWGLCEGASYYYNGKGDGNLP